MALSLAAFHKPRIRMTLAGVLPTRFQACKNAICRSNTWALGLIARSASVYHGSTRLLPSRAKMNVKRLKSAHVTLLLSCVKHLELKLFRTLYPTHPHTQQLPLYSGHVLYVLYSCLDLSVGNLVPCYRNSSEKRREEKKRYKGT